MKLPLSVDLCAWMHMHVSPFISCESTPSPEDMPAHLIPYQAVTKAGLFFGTGFPADGTRLC